MLYPDLKYAGAIVAANWTESSKGTPGLAVTVETFEAGDQINHVWWMTPKTKEYFERDMLDFGVTPGQLRSGPFLQHELPAHLVGREVSFGTKLESWEKNGETKSAIKVAWIGAKKAPSDERGIGYAVASMFGGDAPADSGHDPLPGDDDIPF